MKTTPEGLTHLVNMLVDVVNLQRKAQGTPRACCEVELALDEEESRVSVHLFAEVYLDAPATLSADNNRTLTASDLEAAETALETSGYRVDGRVTPRQAVIEVLDELGLTHFGSRPDRDSDGEPATG